MSTQRRNTVIQVRGLRRRFRKTYALDGIDLEVSRGCVFGLVGENGAGKTTLIKHLLGLLRAKEGTVRVFGMDPVRDAERVLARLGYLSEDRDIPHWMRVDELMRYMRAFYPSWDVQFAEELRETFGLDPEQRIKDLSRGQKAEAGLLAALAYRPELLILDEPSSGLDAVVRQEILAAIIRTVADEGRTVLFSSHLLDEVERVSDYVAMIHHGKVILAGSVDSVKESHRRLTVVFETPLAQGPEWPGALRISKLGDGREWSVVCNGEIGPLKRAVAESGGRIAEEQAASLEDVFIARVGKRGSRP